MRIRTAVLISLLLIVLPLSAQKRTDVLIMKNGDRMTCEIKALSDGVLQVKLDYVDGTISISWADVARIESDRLFIVKTENGSVYTGKISTLPGTPDAPVKIEVAETPASRVELESKEVVKIGGTSDKFWQRFNGDFNVGMTYAKGNRSTQFNIGSSVEYPRDKWSAQMQFNSTLSSNSGSDTVTRNQARFNATRLLRWRNYFYSGNVGFLQSSEQGISLQSSLGAGVGHYFKNTNRTRISMTGGLVWQRTKYTGTATAAGTQNVAGALINGEVRMFKFKKTKLNVNAYLIPSISEPGRVYFNLNESYYIKFYGNLTWNISFYGNWDNKPPVGLPSSDYGTSTGIGWTFGDK